MQTGGDLNEHLQDDINTEDSDVTVSETPELPDTGRSMAAPLVDEMRIITPDQPSTEPVDDEAHRRE